GSMDENDAAHAMPICAGGHRAAHRKSPRQRLTYLQVSPTVANRRIDRDELRAQAITMLAAQCIFGVIGAPRTQQFEIFKDLIPALDQHDPTPIGEVRFESGAGILAAQLANVKRA